MLAFALDALNSYAVKTQVQAPLLMADRINQDLPGALDVIKDDATTLQARRDPLSLAKIRLSSTALLGSTPYGWALQTMVTL